MAFRAVFLDRDGTVNDDPGYLGDADKVVLLPGVGDALSRLKNEFGFKLIVISNQSGIARGLITKEDVEAVNSRINELLKPFKVEIDRFYFCPSHPEFNSPEECECRKPSPKMVFEAASDLDINIKESFLVGDAETDILCGQKAGVGRTILVSTGYGSQHIKNLIQSGTKPDFFAKNFNEVLDYIINEINAQKN